MSLIRTIFGHSCRDKGEFIRDAMERMNMSARAYDRILKVARTIAELKRANN